MVKAVGIPNILKRTDLGAGAVAHSRGDSHDGRVPAALERVLLQAVPATMVLCQSVSQSVSM